MPTINVTKPHNLGTAEATARLNRLEKSWLMTTTKVTVEFKAGAFGIGIDGRVVIDDDSVTVETDQDVGPFESPLEKLIRDKLKVLN